MALIGDFLQSIDAVFVGFAANGAAAVAAAARTPFNVLVTLYVVLWGLAMWRGLIREPLSDGLMRMLKIVLIGTCALNMGIYVPRIANALYRSPDQLAAVLIPSASPAATGTALDIALQRGIDVSTAFIDALSITSPIASFAVAAQGLIVFLATVALVGYATALIVLAKVALSIVLALGPLFIALLLFEPTKHFFSAWIAQALNSLFSYVVAVALVALGMQFFSISAADTLSAMAGQFPDLKSTVRMFIVGGAVFIALLQAGAIASALAGGVQMGTLGGVGWAMRKGGAALGSPAAAWQGARGWNDRRLARDYHRQRLGMAPTLTTRSLGYMRQRLHGTNSETRR
jgi:type IV secretion system protein VirB6